VAAFDQGRFDWTFEAYFTYIGIVGDALRFCSTNHSTRCGDCLGAGGRVAPIIVVYSGFASASQINHVIRISVAVVVVIVVVVVSGISASWSNVHICLVAVGVALYRNAAHADVVARCVVCHI